jgi:hypothetical protein
VFPDDFGAIQPFENNVVVTVVCGRENGSRIDKVDEVVGFGYEVGSLRESRVNVKMLTTRSDMQITAQCTHK